MHLAVRHEDRIDWFAAAVWIAILVAVLTFWAGVGYGIYRWKSAGGPKVSCSEPVKVELASGAISTMHCSHA